MASPFEKAFLSGVTERKRKRCDIKEGLQRLKNVSISELQALCSALDKEDILMIVQAKLPNAIGQFGKYHNTLSLSPQSLHKHCFCFLLGPL